MYRAVYDHPNPLSRLWHMSTVLSANQRVAVELPETAVAAPDRFEYRPALDGVRAMAMLTIIAYHYNYEWAKGGFLSVDTFFVLSGFLITTLLVLEHRRKRTISLAVFWARRARRLLPALLLVLCAVALYTYLEVLPWERTRVRADGFASLFYVANWRFIVDNQDYFSLFAAASPLRHMWTLAIEEQYYLVWPVVVFALMRVGRASTRVLAIACGAGIVVSLALMNARYDQDNPASAYFATDARAQALLLGALLALAFHARRPSPRVQRVLAVAAVAALVVLFVGFHTVSGTAPGYYRGTSFLFATMSALIVAGAMVPGPVSKVLGLRPLAWTGQVSYGLYLWHWPLTVWLVPSRVSLGPTALNALRLTATFAAAALSYYLVERPVREQNWSPRTTLLVFAPAVAAVSAVIWLSASGATPPPSYLAGTAPTPAAIAATDTDSALPDFIWGWGDPLLCPEPRADEMDEARSAASREDAPAASGLAQERILLIGDSTACSLWPGLRAVGDQAGLVTDQGSVFGCGIAIDEFTSTRNEPVTPNTDRCRPFLDVAIPRALARTDPTIVVWMSIWEKSDLVVDGRTIVAGTAEWASEVMTRMDRALATLTANGARVVIVTEAPPAPNAAAETDTFDHDAEAAGYRRLTDLQRAFAARHPGAVTIVDLASQLCPNAPACPTHVAGLEMRPDGHHFTPTTSVWAARFVLAQISATR